MRTMRIALYYPWVYLPGGPERIIVELTNRSRHSWTILTNHYDRAATFPELGRLNVIELPKVPVERSFRRVAAAARRVAFQKLPLEGQDALVVLSEGLGDFVLFLNRSVPAVCLCLTPLRAAFDSYYQDRYVQRKGGSLVHALSLRLAASLYRMVDRVAWKRYRRVLAISGEAKRRIVAGGLSPGADIPILYPGVSLTEQPGPNFEKYFLIPGRIMWTKNLELAIGAFRRMLARRPDLGEFRLVIAGIVDRKSAEYAASLRALSAGCPQIEFLEFPSDARLAALRRSAYLVVYPPFNEDWGLVPLEAMAAGKPVIAVNRGGPAESVVHGETGLLADPTPDAFARAMEHLADRPDLVRSMGARARDHVARFSWDAFCRHLDAELESLVAGTTTAVA